MLGDIIFFLIAGVIVFVTYKFVFAKKQPKAVDTKKNDAPQVQNVQPQPEVVNQNPRNVRNRFANQRNVNLDDPREEEKLNDDEDVEDDDGNPLNKTKKQLQKESKKQAQKEQQEAFKHMLEEKEKKENEKRSKYDEREKQREEEERKQEEIRRQKEEEERKKEEEEYNKWKDMISVEEVGTDVIDKENEENLLQQFIDYITIRKVVMLEDLSNDFKLQTKDVVDRIERLIAAKKLSGIIDDRGKFIYITEDEFKNVMNFIKKRGRISRPDLIFECNKLIKLNPSEEDKQKLKKEQSNLLKQIEVDLNSIKETPAS